MQESGTRRSLLGVGLGLGLAAPFVAAAAAGPWLRSDLVIYTDPTLKPLLQAIGHRFAPSAGTVLVFAAPPMQNVALLAHGTQDDVLITLDGAMLRAEAAMLTRGSRKLWRNRLVLAARGAGSPLDFDPAALVLLLGSGQLAAPDPTPASSVDGPAVLASLGLSAHLAGRTLGAVNTADVAFMLRDGSARLGLCHVTDIGRGLHVAMRLPDAAYAPIQYRVALTRTAWSRHQDQFLSFLSGSTAAALARQAGLEITA